jgi:hypothetical protein
MKLLVVIEIDQREFLDSLDAIMKFRLFPDYYSFADCEEEMGKLLDCEFAVRQRSIMTEEEFDDFREAAVEEDGVFQAKRGDLMLDETDADRHDVYSLFVLNCDQSHVVGVTTDLPDFVDKCDAESITLVYEKRMFSKDQAEKLLDKIRDELG